VSLVSFSIQFKNPSEVQKFPLDLTARMSEVFVETANALVQGAVNTAREQVLSESRKPLKGTGRYLKSIHSEVEVNKFQVIGKVASDHPQAAVLEFGSRPHVIKARNKETLFWPGARFPVKQVNHPGTPAFRVLGGSAEQAVENAQAMLNQAINKNFG
jgi:hypothetical protein